MEEFLSNPSLPKDYEASNFLDTLNTCNIKNTKNESYVYYQNSKPQPKNIQLNIPKVFKPNINQLNGRGNLSNPSTPTTCVSRKPSLTPGRRQPETRDFSSLSPRRYMIPLSKVATGDVNISIKLQEDLLKRTQERKILAQVVRLKNERENVEISKNFKEEEKPSSLTKKLEKEIN